jgi:hypothetical protein
MAGLDPAIHVYLDVRGVDHRVKPGDDDCGRCDSVRHLRFQIQFSNSHASLFSRLVARGKLSCTPHNTRGMERREAHLVSFRFRHRLRGDALPSQGSDTTHLRLAALHAPRVSGGATESATCAWRENNHARLFEN